jgi:hypothetical protein
VGEVEREVAGAVAVRACVQRVQEAAVRLGTKEVGALGGALAGWAIRSAQLGRPLFPFFFFFFSSIAFSRLKMYLRHQNKSEKCK